MSFNFSKDVLKVLKKYKIDKSSDRNALETYADVLLEQNPDTKNITDYAKLYDDAQNYILDKQWNKRRGEEKAFDIAFNKKHNSNYYSKPKSVRNNPDAVKQATKNNKKSPSDHKLDDYFREKELEDRNTVKVKASSDWQYTDDIPLGKYKNEKTWQELFEDSFNDKKISNYLMYWAKKNPDVNRLLEQLRENYFASNGKATSLFINRKKSLKNKALLDAMRQQLQDKEDYNFHLQLLGDNLTIPENKNLDIDKVIEQLLLDKRNKEQLDYLSLLNSDSV